MLRYVCCDKTSDGRQIWEGQWWSRTHTHMETHTACAQRADPDPTVCQFLMLNTDSPRIFTINVWICNWSNINSDWGDKAQVSLFCMCMYVVVLLECPAVCRRPLLLTFCFPLCREAKGKSCTCERTDSDTWTLMNTCRNSRAIKAPLCLRTNPRSSFTKWHSL